jgi:hypothetical protein
MNFCNKFKQLDIRNPPEEEGGDTSGEGMAGAEDGPKMESAEGASKAVTNGEEVISEEEPVTWGSRDPIPPGPKFW